MEAAGGLLKASYNKVLTIQMFSAALEAVKARGEQTNTFFKEIKEHFIFQVFTSLRTSPPLNFVQAPSNSLL